MPRGPRGEKRPAGVIGAAVMVAKIATGEIEDIADWSRLASRSPPSVGRTRSALRPRSALRSPDAADRLHRSERH
jgi:hypothetical protein